MHWKVFKGLYYISFKIWENTNWYVKFYIADATIYVGGLDDKVAETLMWELFVQAGPVGMV